jgi:hypothetical protein
MKNKKVPLLPELDGIEMEAAGSLLVKNSKEHAINVLNWPELFNYLPESKFNIARTTDNLWIHFRVTEQNVKAVHLVDQEEVWKDSCVEFFVKLPYAEKYTNFEFNCIGTCLSTRRKSRTEDVVPLSPEEMQSIKRFASLGNQKIELKGKSEWQLTVKIPFKILSFEKSLSGITIYGNFYKCGDETAKPHYVSWSKINTEQPDFHQPDFFGMLAL